MREPEFYKIETTVTIDHDSPNIYTVAVGLYYLQKPVDESKYEEIHQNTFKKGTE